MAKSTVCVFLASFLAVFGLLMLLAIPAHAEAEPFTNAAPHQSYGYVVTNFDDDLLIARQNLDRFWGDPSNTPGNENKWYTAPGLSWLNELGGTHTGCGDMEPAEADRKAFFYCGADKVIYIDSSRLLILHANSGYDGILAMLAHEWGHHIQNLLNSPLSGPQREWQADCYSGTALRWFQPVYTKLNRTQLGYLAYTTGGGSSENTRTHGTGDSRQAWWLYGWDTFNPSKRDAQFSCTAARY